MALTRKPRVGEVLIYDDGRSKPRRYFAERFDSIHPEILHIRPGEGGDATTIIWSFRDGLNQYLSHVEATP